VAEKAIQRPINSAADQLTGRVSAPRFLSVTLGVIAKSANPPSSRSD